MKNKINILMIVLLSLIAVSPVFAVSSILEQESHDYSINEFLSTSSNKLGLLIPAILLAVTIITFAIDFGTVGVSSASSASLVVLYFLKIVYINPISLISFIIIIGIMSYKMQG